jgi:regulator of RNase E activity RraA
VLLEPGRAIVGPCAVTIYRVGTVKRIPGVRTYVAVDGGMSDNLRPMLYGARYEAEIAHRFGGEQLCTVAGMHCESGDILVRDVLLDDPEPGDVLVVQGVPNISSMGGVSASIGKRQGEAGAIVDGAVRDVDHSRAIGYPIWSASVSPITGKWRIETMAVNDPVHIAGIEVRPGDLVVADECGVCFVPYARAAEVLAVAQRLAASEARRLQALRDGMTLAEFVKQPR